MRNIFVFYLIFIVGILNASGNDGSEPQKSFHVSGYVKDSRSGESLIAASIYIKETGSGTVTNPYGYYSIGLAKGTYTIGVSYIGYQGFERKIDLQADIILNIDLIPEVLNLEEVVISSQRKNENVSSLEMGTNHLIMQEIRKMPAFMGEVDLIKAIQLLPGVTSTSEGSSGYSVRGGASDQNMILLDEAPVYNGSHMLGFFSIFNNDAIKDAKIYKGDIPACYGGRLASLLEVRMKDGNSKDFHATGGIGLISSRLTLEGPIKKEKASFLIAGRRTYADIFLPFAKNKDIRDNNLHFYDLNLKLNHIINDNNRIFFSSYLGRDVFKNDFAGLYYGNRTATLRWNHLFNNRLFSNFSLIHSYYDYKLATPSGRPDAFEWKSILSDYGINADLTWYANRGIRLRFGASSVYHSLLPGLVQGKGTESALTKFELPENYALEHGFYIQTESKISEYFNIKYGLRVSGFQNVGKAVVYNYDDSYNTIDSTIYSKGDFYNSYWGMEPRVGFTFLFSEATSVKVSYSRTRQYLQLAQNSTAGTPLDIWFPASKNVKPQVSDQFSAGIFRNFRHNSIETSIETYYKKLQNTIDFRDHAFLLLNPKLEGELRTGEGYSMGLEFLVKLNLDKLNGWIGYTLSRTERRIAEINNNKFYPAPYDKPHIINLVLNYPVTENLEISTNWIYATGNPVTFPVGRFELLGAVLPIYSERNAYRMPDYHRLDVSITYERPKKEGRKWQSEWNLSVYNAYGRHNPWSISFTQDEDDPRVTKAEMTYLFSIIPSVTYNFKF